ncbi:hypothetical protein KAU45_06950, partial [bacterium]|nr:hypothetical protein [bacterium]
MTRIGRFLLLAALIALVLLVGCKPQLSFAAFFDSVYDEYYMFMIDDDGQLWYATQEGWKEDGLACPGKAPFSLGACYDIGLDDWIVAAVDTDGQ